MLLDTCALLWLAEGGKRLSPETRDRIEQAPVVYISAISAFEIGVKYRSGKLKLPVPPADWFGAVVEHHGIARGATGLGCLRRCYRSAAASQGSV